jgi:hypothetical protein
MPTAARRTWLPAAVPSVAPRAGRWEVLLSDGGHIAEIRSRLCAVVWLVRQEFLTGGAGRCR